MKSMLLTLTFLAMSFSVFAVETRTDCEAMNNTRQKIVKNSKETKKSRAAVTRQ